MTQQLTIFSNSGKTYMGTLCTDYGSADDIPAFAGNLKDTATNYWVVKAPCEINFKLVEEDNKARLDFKNIIPIMPYKLFTDNSSNIYFAFPKDSTVLSTVSDNKISNTLQNAYKQMTGL